MRDVIMKKTTKSPKKPDQQLEKFKAAAKEFGCEDNDDHYDALLGKVAQQKPQPRINKKAKKEK
jgi:hypothetical protein